MINEIHIDKVTSYKTPSKIIPDIKVSLIYGLNGSGKSTFSNLFYNPKDSEFSECKITEDSESEFLVYNQKFLSDYFYEEDSLKGIFTLSKANKEVLVKIDQEENNLKTLEDEKTKISEKLAEFEKQLETAKTKATDKIWEIKTKYTGGDRVLEYCLDGLKRTEKLFNHLKSLNRPSEKPTYTINGMKKESDLIRGDKAHKIDRIGIFEFSGIKVEDDDLFKKIIVGSQEGTVAEFINNLENSDWVKTGLNYVPDKIEKSNAPCPFCQEDTITESLLDSIIKVFNDSYDTDISLLEGLKDRYISLDTEINFGEISSLAVVDTVLSQKWKSACSDIKSIYRENRLLIDDKIKGPSRSVTLRSSREAVSSLNGIIDEINILVDSHNKKLANKAASLANINGRFWDLMRWDYDQTLSSYTDTELTLNSEITSINSKHELNRKNTLTVKEKVVELRKGTVNIEEAITNINNGLSEIGIAGFSVVKYSENLYRISRTDAEKDAFHSLSEGEKTVISFLYFLELCKGQRSASSSPKKKVVVIDDPISSLSHIYVFNIGQLIKKYLFNAKEFEQILVLTHSLYFLYELTHTNREKKHKIFIG
ncbi:MAG: AAA family ATPase [Methylococcales bacterium]|nr:AAA family ATPase [Methylococcales bacterium]